MSKIVIAMAQFNPLVGDIDGNAEKIIALAKKAEGKNADVVVFPELSLLGYPPEDLLLRPSLNKRVERALERICAEKVPLMIVLGYPKQTGAGRFNLAGVIDKGKLIYEYAKQCLPNYQVFDEYRYFTPGNTVGLVQCKGVKLGISICEDIWDGGPLTQLKNSGSDLMLNLNGSPFHQKKQELRRSLVAKRARDLDVPIVYVNQVGGQDELVFDGGSMFVNRNGEVVGGLPQFEEDLLCAEFNTDQHDIVSAERPQKLNDDPLADIYQALVLGVRDYVNKNHFKGVVLGLSGGIDSALTLAIAADALGPERVEAVMMPFTYTSDLSKNDAEDEAKRLGVNYRVIGIEPMYEAFIQALEPAFAGLPKDATEENIQARSRGILLMALSNKLGYLVLTTGNKSEMAVGYATLYGDMAGGLDVLKDVPKTTVFALSRYRNTLGEVIPESVITRPPSAELAPDQKDEDSLPPYDILDQILHKYIEEDASAEAIIAEGFEKEVVYKVLRLVDINEYKRRQAPIGIRISERAFGKDRRYPITNGWKIGD